MSRLVLRCTFLTRDPSVWADEALSPWSFLKKRPEDDFPGETAYMPLLLSELFKQR